MDTASHFSIIPVVLADLSSVFLGGQRQTLALARALAASPTFSPLLAGLGGSPLLRAAGSEGLPILPLRPGRFFRFRAKAALKKLLKEAAPCIAHSQDAQSAAMIADISSHNPGVVHIHTKREALPVPGGRKGAYLRGARAVAALSSSMGALLAAGGVEGARIRIIPSGIDSAGCTKHRLRGDGRFIFAAGGELTPQNGHDILIHALPFLYRFPDMPDWEVRFTGQGELLQPLLDLALTLGVKGRLAFLGTQDNNLILPDCDAMIAPAVADAVNGEDTGDPLREGWATGLPVIASNLLSHCEMVRDGENCLIYPMDDPETLALHMADVARNASLRERLTKAGAQALESCSDQDTAEAYMHLYLNFLSPKGRERALLRNR